VTQINSTGNETGNFLSTIKYTKNYFKEEVNKKLSNIVGAAIQG
jgi:hypothetical protein